MLEKTETVAVKRQLRPHQKTTSFDRGGRQSVRWQVAVYENDVLVRILSPEEVPADSPLKKTTLDQDHAWIEAQVNARYNATVPPGQKTEMDLELDRFRTAKPAPAPTAPTA